MKWIMVLLTSYLLIQRRLLIHAQRKCRVLLSIAGVLTGAFGWTKLGFYKLTRRRKKDCLQTLSQGFLSPLEMAWYVASYLCLQMFRMWRRYINSLDIGGGFLAYFLFGAMKQSAKED